MAKKQIKNIKELASLLNLSITTVSRVLNGKAEAYRISKDTQKRIFKIAKEYNYKPNTIARGLKLSRTDTIGLIVPDVSNPFFSAIIKSIENEVMKMGYMLLVCDSNDNLNTEKELLLLLLSRQVDGMIVAPIGKKFSHIVKVQKSGLPIVVIDRIPSKTMFHIVTTDSYSGTVEAINYLVSIGHKRIGCINGITDVYPCIERLKGYKDALKNLGIEYDADLVSGSSFKIENGYKETKRLMQLENKPTAIFAFNNMIGLGVLKAASELNIKIPDDLSLIAFDEQPYSAFLSPPMTTMEQNKAGIGVKAVQILMNLIEMPDNKNMDVIKLAVTMKKRNSVKPIDK
ncbi:LacI family DNA-binding transcriptional regulator [Bacteroidota bacterium]